MRWFRSMEMVIDFGFSTEQLRAVLNLILALLLETGCNRKKQYQYKNNINQSG